MPGSEFKATTPDYVTFVDANAYHLRGISAGQTAVISAMVEAAGQDRLDMPTLLDQVRQAVRESVHDATIRVDVNLPQGSGSDDETAE